MLNSPAKKEKALAAIREMGVQTVQIFLDRDTSGQELTQYFGEQLPGIEIIDEFCRYADHKDVNEWWMSQQQRKIQ